MKFKMLIIVFAWMCTGLPNAFSDNIRGGDMPFPIGKIADFPIDNVKGVWGSEKLQQRLFKLKPLKDVLPKGSIEVYMLNFQRQVVAAGIGLVGEDRIFRARLEYVNSKDVVFVGIANYCEDEGFEDKVDKSKCVNSKLVVSIEERPQNGKNKKAVYFFLKKTR